MLIFTLISLKRKYRINGKVKFVDSVVIKLSDEFKEFINEQNIKFNK